MAGSAQGAWPRGGLPGASCSVWVLDFVQERLHHMSAGHCEDTFGKAGDSESRKGLALA